MKIWHVVAIALTGWYLMVPPPLSPSPQDGRIEPLSRWTTTGTFESKKACEAERVQFSKVDPGAEAYGYRGLPPEEVYDAQCVATDDARLKP